MNFFSKAADFVEDAADVLDKAQSFVSVDGGDDEANQTRDLEFEDEEGGERDFAQLSEKAIPATVRMFSGCKDAQTSADVYDVSSFGLPEDSGPGGAGGACTNSMMACLHNNDKPTWLELLSEMRDVLDTKGYTQIPELSASRQIDLDETFSLECPSSSGKKKSLLIGINYVGQQGELRGCHNDVLVMQQFLETQGFDTDEENQLILMDDGEHREPTYDNILRAFEWLVEGAEAGDSFFMHYSGHGGSMRDDNGDEQDNKDETMIPVDYQAAGQIRDDLILAELVLELPKDSQLTVVMDCCHSGTILDLPYIFIADGEHLEAVNNGGAPHNMQENQGFNFSKLFKIGQMLYKMHQQGRSHSEIAQAAAKQLYKSGMLGSLSSGLKALGFGA